MEVYVIVTSSWNAEYGYDEYSKPIEICSTKEKADELASQIEADLEFEEIHVIPYTLK